MEQDLKTLDVTKLNPLSPEVISRQATINIGKMTLLLDTISFLVDRCIRQTASFKASHSSRYLVSPAGTIGHVAHGKSTVVKAISGVQASDVVFRSDSSDLLSFALRLSAVKVLLGILCFLNHLS